VRRYHRRLPGERVSTRDTGSSDLGTALRIPNKEQEPYATTIQELTVGIVKWLRIESQL